MKFYGNSVKVSTVYLDETLQRKEIPNQLLHPDNKRKTHQKPKNISCDCSRTGHCSLIHGSINGCKNGYKMRSVELHQETHQEKVPN